MSDNPKSVFEKEIQLLSHAREQLDHGEDYDYKEEFIRLTEAYSTLLNDVRLLTSVSDRLQRKNNQINETLTEINEELNQQAEEVRTTHEALTSKSLAIQQHIEELKATRNNLSLAKVRRRATSIIMIVAIILLVLTELFDRFVMQGSAWGSKILLIILIKPLDNFIVERLKRKMQNIAQQTIVSTQ